jgi:hypothetical protein
LAGRTVSRQSKGNGIFGLSVILLLMFMQRRGEAIKSGDKGGIWPILHTGGKKRKKQAKCQAEHTENNLRVSND